MFFCSPTGLFLQPIGDLSTFSTTETMIPINPINRKIALVVFALSLFPFLQISAQDGKQLFQSKCAACHGILHGEPGLMGFEERGPWQDRNNLYEWIRNPAKFMEKDPYARRLKEQYGSMMRAFPEIKNEEIDAIVDYINYLTHYGMAQSANVE